jgi:PKD repeat protein
MRRRRLLIASVVLTVCLGALHTGQASVQAAVPAVHFSASGDFASTTNTSAVLAGLKSSASELHLALGDLSYGTTGAEQSWCNFVTSRLDPGFPFELVSGNHESNGLNGNINDFSACLPNQLPGAIGTYGRQWFVDYPQQSPTVRLVMISPGLSFPDGLWSYAAGSPQYQWTAAAIDGARAAGIPWVVVGMHKPCLSLGDYTCEAAPLNDLLMSKKVDLVLTGHEHIYQRTKQLALNPACTSVAVGTVNPSCVVDSDDDLVRGAGTVFATVGTSGVPLRDVHTGDPELGYFAAWSGANITPSNGFLDMAADADTLSARFVPSTGSYADAFTIQKSTTPPGNQAPVAVVGTPTCQGFACLFDGSASSDADGSIVGYAWDFGDGNPGSGPTPSHVYGAAGSYTVRLTVTDNDGGTASTSRQVTVSSPSTQIVADDFSRTVASGLGVADVGGPWSVGGAAADAFVASGTGNLVMRTPGAGRLAAVPGVTTSAADISVVLAADKAATGSGIYLSLVGRRVTGEGDYRGVVVITPAGAVRGRVDRKTWQGVDVTILATKTVAGLTYSPGDLLRLRLQVTGTTPTTLRLKVWREGSAEPAAWLLSGLDSTAGLQSVGYVGVQPYLSSSATNAPVTAKVDGLRVTVITP